MIYCSLINCYVDQEKKCMLCTFYKVDEDSCDYENWYPGLKKGRDLEHESNN